MFFVGSVAGTLIFGILADKVGRLPILVLVYVISFFGNILTIFATDVDLFSLCRLIAGMATDSNFVLMYILGEIITFVFYYVLTKKIMLFSQLWSIFVHQCEHLA